VSESALAELEAVTCVVFVLLCTLCEMAVLLVPFDAAELAADELLIPTLDLVVVGPIGAGLGVDVLDECVIPALEVLTGTLTGGTGSLPSSKVYSAKSQMKRDELCPCATNVCVSLLSPSDASIGTEYKIVEEVSGIWVYEPANAPSKLNVVLTRVSASGTVLGTMPKRYTAVPVNCRVTE